MESNTVILNKNEYVSLLIGLNGFTKEQAETAYLELFIKQHGKTPEEYQAEWDRSGAKNFFEEDQNFTTKKFDK